MRARSPTRPRPDERPADELDVRLLARHALELGGEGRPRRIDEAQRQAQVAAQVRRALLLEAGHEHVGGGVVLEQAQAQHDGRHDRLLVDVLERGQEHGRVAGVAVHPERERDVRLVLEGRRPERRAQPRARLGPAGGAEGVEQVRAHAESDSPA
jgi:hypothetical protein